MVKTKKKASKAGAKKAPANGQVKRLPTEPPETAKKQQAPRQLPDRADRVESMKSVVRRIAENIYPECRKRGREVMWLDEEQRIAFIFDHDAASLDISEFWDAGEAANEGEYRGYPHYSWRENVLSEPAWWERRRLQRRAVVALLNRHEELNRLMGLHGVVSGEEWRRQWAQYESRLDWDRGPDVMTVHAESWSAWALAFHVPDTLSLSDLKDVVDKAGLYGTAVAMTSEEWEYVNDEGYDYPDSCTTYSELHECRDALEKLGVCSRLEDLYLLG